MQNVNKRQVDDGRGLNALMQILGLIDSSHKYYI